MTGCFAHAWDVSPQEAITIQKALRDQVIQEDRLDGLATVGGVDIGFEDGGRVTRAAVVVLSFPELALLELAVVRQPTAFPYVPGLLSFREVPAALEALTALARQPDVLLADGQGRAHPRRFGLACHLGLLGDRPAIGAAKSRLIGRHDPVPEARGAWQPLVDRDEIVGAAVRPRTGVRPLYVSIGHRVSLATAIEIVLACTPRHRLPETTRLAHRLASG